MQGKANEKRKTKLIVKTYSGFNQLDADQEDQLIERLCRYGVLFYYWAAERVSAVASLSFLQRPVMNRLSISVLSAVSYMMYMIVCV